MATNVQLQEKRALKLKADVSEFIKMTISFYYSIFSWLCIFRLLQDHTENGDQR